jgi:hypothetical protein
MKTTTRIARSGALALVLVVAAACGSDDGDDSAADSKDTLAAYCAHAKKLAKLDGFPSVAQLEKAQELAPQEIQDEAAVVVPAMTEAGDDVVAQFNAIGEDDVEGAIERINEFETESCDIDHSGEANDPGPGGSFEVEDDAAQVAVTAKDFEFVFDPPTAPGRTSFVMTNEGEQAHFLAVAKLKDGVTLDQALQDEEGTTIEKEWSTRIASAGDDETVTLDLEPGHYAVVCFLPDADGTPHAMKGMVGEFTVA